MTTSVRNATRTRSKIRGRPGQRRQVIVARDPPEIARDHRCGLGPAHQHSTEKAETDQRPEDHQCRKEQSAHGIDVVHRVERHPPLHARRLVAQQRCRPGMRAFMDAQRKDKHNKLEQSLNEICRLQKSLLGRKSQVIAFGVFRAGRVYASKREKQSDHSPKSKEITWKMRKDVLPCKGVSRPFVSA